MIADQVSAITALAQEQASAADPGAAFFVYFAESVAMSLGQKLLVDALDAPAEATTKHPPGSTTTSMPEFWRSPSMGCGHVTTAGPVTVQSARSRPTAAEQRASSSGVSSRSGACAESAMEAARRAPGMGMTCSPSESSHASTTC